MELIPCFSLSTLTWSVFIQIFLLTSAFSVIRGNNETDRLSLLAFKAQIVDDPLGILNSWNGSRHFCEWPGITCGHRHRRVTMLDLQSSQLKGLLSPHIGNLSFLRMLNIENNTFAQNIPPEIGRLLRLRNLSLANNSFNGQIPVNLSLCSDLQLLNLAGNNLTGKLPNNLGSLSKLQVLDLSSNNLVGEIPSSFGNFSSLKNFFLEMNSLHGSIPNSFGRLKSLTYLSLGGNNLTGTVPSSIYNLSSIQHFWVYMNQLEGSLPHDLGHTLPNLETFIIHTNQFSGPVPVTISNASKLNNFQITSNNFTGKVPSFSRLSKLYWLGMALNNLGYGEDDDLDFLSSLVNCTNLEIFDIGDNKFGGALPESVSNFSRKLKIMVFGGAQIQGSIPTGIGNLIRLETLSFELNQLSGPIPSSIGKLQKLNYLYMNNNELSGPIPSSLGNLTSLGTLYLDVNNLEGKIPASLGQCKNLLALGLSLNNLSGFIPMQVLGLSSLSKDLDLSRNHLIGSIPIEVGKLVNLGYLDLSNNELSGKIPESLGMCMSLENLYLDHNYLHGPIPPSLASLKGTEEIDLSSNNFSEKIPMYLEGFQFLQNLNLSFNDLEGDVPVQGIFNNASAFSVMGNNRLCGGISQLKLPRCASNPHSKKHKHFSKVKLIVIVSCGFIVLILVLLIILLYRSRKNGSKSIFESAPALSLLQVSYGDLLKATDGFSSENLIGAGSFGSVYKGILNHEEERVVAVKVLNLQKLKASKSFIAECKALIRVKHRNLVKLLTVCSSIDFQRNDFKALVYEFMVNGSLEEWLHTDHRENLEGGQRHLNIIQRINIAIDVASALDYLHNQCHTPIVHCDLKPSNILLNSELTAHVGDFGLARFLPNSSHPFSLDDASSIGLKGSIGYAAPEYGMGNDVSELGDVYSYGILLLEMFTGKRPTHAMFKDGLNLHKFALNGLGKDVEQILDPKLIGRGECSNNSSSRNENNGGDQNERNMECMISIVKIAISCSEELPRERMDIRKVVVQLLHMRDRLVGTRMTS